MDFWQNILKVFHVPRVDDIGLPLDSAAQKQSVVDFSAEQSLSSRVFDGRFVFVAVQGDGGQTIFNLHNKSKRLFGLDRRLNGQRGHDGVYLSERMDAAGRPFRCSGTE